MVRYGVVWYGMVWYCMVWYGMVWYGMVFLVDEAHLLVVIVVRVHGWEQAAGEGEEVEVLPELAVVRR